MLRHFHLIPEHYGQTDGQTDRRMDRQTELLYQHRISVLMRDKKDVAYDDNDTYAQKHRCH